MRWLLDASNLPPLSIPTHSGYFERKRREVAYEMTDSSNSIPANAKGKRENVRRLLQKK